VSDDLRDNDNNDTVVGRLLFAIAASESLDAIDTWDPPRLELQAH